MYWKIKDGQIEYGNKTLIMGIVNVTPDSFSDGGETLDAKNAINAVNKMIDEGADIIDIGAQSTRPDCKIISEKEEWERLAPVIEAVGNNSRVAISVDTFYPSVAEKALCRGANIINDVSGIISPEMAKIVKFYGSGWILMHNGSASISQVRDFFVKSIEKCESLGIERNQLCLDMGIGFGKDYDENMALLANIDKYKIASCPLLLATSRKRVIGQGSSQENVKKRIYGNIAAHTLAVMQGVDIIRVHDVKNEKQGIEMAQNLRKYRDNG